jgi:hypothetical protein
MADHRRTPERIAEPRLRAPVRAAPTAHPPSPRQLREHVSGSSATTPVRRGARVGYLRRHWRGELPLAAAVIVSSALLWGLVQLLQFAARRVSLIDHPLPAAALWLAEMLTLIFGVVWWGVGVQRAATAHLDRGGSMLVALMAGLTGLAAFAWVGAFWWFSARHVAPEVWATLTGATPAAQVRYDAPRQRLVLTGDLDFGSTRALRAALDAHADVRVVQLESRGGRVKEGLALGALLRDRGLDTLVTGECSSACVTAFAGGARRLITAEARLGLHSAGGAGATAQSVAAANRDSDEFIAARGVDLRVVEKGAAVAHDAIWFPPPVTLLASGLATHYAHEVLKR